MFLIARNIRCRLCGYARGVPSRRRRQEQCKRLADVQGGTFILGTRQQAVLYLSIN